MSSDRRIAELEAVLAQFLKPIRGIPFPVVIRAMADHEVIPVDSARDADALLIDTLRSVAAETARTVREDPIRRNRPNEVGNDIKPFVLAALLKHGLRAERPRSKSGKAKQTGYPDLLFFDKLDRVFYLECKIFGESTEPTTMRSFYLSPSESFKVAADARHLLIAFAVSRTPIANSRDSLYRAVGFKLIDLSGLNCDVKYEFNSDNRCLYAPEMVLAEGSI